MQQTRAWGSVVLLAVACPAGALAPCGPWQQVYPWPPAQLSGVAYGDGRFVAVGEGVVTSDDGIVWSSAPPLGPTALESLNDVVWTGDRFVAVGGVGDLVHESPLVAVSRDGSSWTVSQLEDDGLFEGVACAGSECVAVGTTYGGTPTALVYHSPDGEQWTRVASPATQELLTVAWGDGVWVAAGASILRSSDGLVWEVVNRDWWVLDLTWDGMRFVGLTQDGLVESTNGAAWTWLAAIPSSLGEFFIASHGCQLLSGWGTNRTHQGVVASSEDGIRWSPLVETPGVPRAAVWAEGQWVVVGDPGLAGTSPDGSSWRWLGQDGFVRLFDMASHGEEAVAVGFVPAEHDVAVVSADLVGWNDLATGTGVSWLSDVSWTGERWVAVGGLDTVLASSDLGTWTSLVPVPDQYRRWAASASSASRLVVVGSSGQSGAIAGSTTDDQSWSYSPLGTPGEPRDVLWNGSEFIVAGDRLVGWSDDGSVWTVTATDSSLLKLASDGRRLVAVGAGGVGLWSDDGRAWNVGEADTTGDLSELTWAGDRFVAGSTDGTLLESADGAIWAPAEPFPFGPLEGLAWTGRELLAVTQEGSIARRPCGEGSPLPDSAPRMTVPVVAHRPGASGTFWRSDLHVVSPGDRWSEVWLGLAPSGEDRPSWERVLLPPRGQLDRDDVVARTFDLEQAAGLLLVASEQPLAVSSRTFTRGGAGTWGQEVPALAAVDLARGAASVVLPMLRQDAAFRTNLGLVNASEAPLALAVELLDAAGRLLGVLSRDLGPLGWVQEDGVLASLGAAPLADAYAVVSADDPGASFTAYASVVDNATGDPTLVVAARASAVPLVVPAVAHGPGVAGTFWESDLAVANPGDAPAEYRLELLSGEALASPAFSLAPGEARGHSDVVATVFGRSGSAALRVVPTAGRVAVASRTFTAAAGGRFGQGVPAVPEGAGLVNPGDDDLTATVELHRGDGSLVGRIERVVPGHSLVVTTRVFAVAGADEVESGYAVVRTDTPDPSILAWASVVDNATGDPVLVLER